MPYSCEGPTKWGNKCGTWVSQARVDAGHPWCAAHDPERIAAKKRAKIELIRKAAALDWMARFLRPENCTWDDGTIRIEQILSKLREAQMK